MRVEYMHTVGREAERPRVVPRHVGWVVRALRVRRVGIHMETLVSHKLGPMKSATQNDLY